MTGIGRSKARGLLFYRHLQQAVQLPIHVTIRRPGTLTRRLPADPPQLVDLRYPFPHDLQETVCLAADFVPRNGSRCRPSHVLLIMCHPWFERREQLTANRFDCLTCHLPQSGAPPLVQNTFSEVKKAKPIAPRPAAP